MDRTSFVRGLLSPSEAYGSAESQPARMNPAIARRSEIAARLMSPPTSVMDERYPAWKKSQDQAEQFLLAADFVSSAIPAALMAAPYAKKGLLAAGKTLAPKVENYMARTGLLQRAAPEYQGLHKPPMKGSGAPLHDVTGGGNYYPDDVYSSMAARYYGTGEPNLDARTVSIIQQYKGKPDASVTMYRAIPYEKTASERAAQLEKEMASFMRRGKTPQNSTLKGSAWYNNAAQELQKLKAAPVEAASQPKIHNGDWVTINREYAKMHGESALNGNYKIISQKVPARKLFTNGDSIHEFGYDESGRALLQNLLGVGSVGAAGVVYQGSKK